MSVKLQKHDGLSLIVFILIISVLGLLISISIPFVEHRREELRQMEDIGNVRMAKEILRTEVNAGTCVRETVYVYDADYGEIRENKPEVIVKICPYGRSGKRQGKDFDEQSGVQPSIPRGKILYVMLDEQGDFLACWGTAPLSLTSGGFIID